MKIARVGCFALSTALVAGCSTVPEKANFAVVLPGRYQVISDCAFLEFQKADTGWTKTDFPSMSKVEFTFGTYAAVAARIYVSSAGEGQTKVESFHQQAVWGRDFWEKKHRPIFEKCSSDLAAIKPLTTEVE